MKYTFHPEARNELSEAVEFYKEHLPKLGAAFLYEVYSTILRIIEFPIAFPLQSKNIVAVTHLSREPGYWKKRLTHAVKK